MLRSEGLLQVCLVKKLVTLRQECIEEQNVLNINILEDCL